MTPLDYEYLRKILKERSGLDLAADKQYLVESRLVPLARKAGLPGIGDLVQKMKRGAEALTADVVEAMTTNETFFFRDKIPFDHLKEAGAALSGWRTEIVATDLSLAVLEKSKAGIFSQFEVQRGLPIQLLVKYFTQIGDLWQLNADIRGMVQHRQLNLLQDFSHLGTFDIIFCRNVLIYFDQTTKASIFDRLSRMLEPDGVLALGAAESVVGITSAFKPYPDRRGLYRPNVAPAARGGITPIGLRAAASAAR